MNIVFGKEFDAKVKWLSKLKKTFKVRQSINYQEIIIGEHSKIIFNDTNTFQKGLFLFSMVKRDVSNYLKENGYITPYDELPVNNLNSNFDDENKIIGVDINNAYWSIARLKGYITEKTYLKGLEQKDYKPLRLSALSSLGKDRVYKVYKEGEHKHNEIKKGNNELQNVYLDIRFSTYGVMREIADMLGNDFKAWKTDCIVFNDTPENRNLVTSSMESYGLEWKIEKK